MPSGSGDPAHVHRRPSHHCGRLAPDLRRTRRTTKSTAKAPIRMRIGRRRRGLVAGSVDVLSEVCDGNGSGRRAGFKMTGRAAQARAVCRICGESITRGRLQLSSSPLEAGVSKTTYRVPRLSGKVSSPMFGGIKLSGDINTTARGTDPLSTASTSNRRPPTADRRLGSVASRSDDDDGWGAIRKTDGRGARAA